MYYREYKGYTLAIEEYTADTAEGFSHIHYLGKCKELGFESREHEYSHLMFNFHIAVDKRIKEKKAELEERFLAIKEGVNNAESQFEMYNYATSTWPEFVEELLRIIKEKKQ